MSASRERRVVLPSGRRVIVRVRDVARAKTSKKERGLFADVLGVLADGRLVVERAEGGRVAVETLPLRDFHVLRDFAVRARLVVAEPEVVHCDNCDAELSFDPASLPLDDLDDRYEDEEPATELTTKLPGSVRVGDREHAILRMRPVTVAEARPLWRVLGHDRPFRITPKLLAAMGVVALEGDGGSKVTDPRLLAQALADASDDAWRVVEETFLDLAYPPRAITSITCAACDTVHDLEVPWPRELEPGQYHPRRDPDAPFPSVAVLERRARAMADDAFRKLDAGGLTLRVEDGVAEVDSGGVPMLGSYTPEPRDDGGTDFVVRIYYRTFERAFRDDATFDWEHELEETIEHEAQHHLYYLSGHDPMDEAERAETERDQIRRVGGRKRYEKLQRAALVGGVWDIVRVLGPALVLVALVVALLSQCAH